MSALDLFAQRARYSSGTDSKIMIPLALPTLHGDFECRREKRSKIIDNVRDISDDGDPIQSNGDYTGSVSQHYGR